MKKKSILIKIILILVMNLSSITYFEKDLLLAKVSFATGSVEFTIENDPKVDKIAILKIQAIAGIDVDNAEVVCHLPLRLELIDGKNYVVTFKEFSGTKFNHVLLWSGSMKKGEMKTISFKVVIPDEEKYIITAWALDNYATLEIDLGDPEPPEWNPQLQQVAGIKDDRDYIKSGIKRLQATGTADLEIPKEELPPLRTELKMRTKERPSLTIEDLPIEEKTNSKGGIPFRHLVYVEKESPEVEVNCILPSGFEIVGRQQYKTSQDPEGNTKVLLYSGPMRFKECKALYFRVTLAKPLNIGEREAITKTITVETKILTLENETLTKTDSETIRFGRILY